MPSYPHPNDAVAVSFRSFLPDCDSNIIAAPVRWTLYYAILTAP